MNNNFTKKNIILTNDDGFQADGIEVLYESLSQFFNVTVFAPFNNKSGQSHSITLGEPIRTQKNDNGYIVYGTPVDCVYLGLGAIGLKNVDMVISGINEGCNLGDDYHYSATIAAAREAALYNIPSIALSMGDFSASVASLHADFISSMIMKHFLQFQAGTVCSINFPKEKSHTFAQAKLGHRQRDFIDFEHHHSRVSKKDLYWIGRLCQGQTDDFSVVEEGHISYTLVDYSSNKLGEYVADQQLFTD